MSIMQRLTLIGLYNYDNKLFDGLTLPEQYDKNTFIDALMIEHGEKLVLYSDYDFMKYSIGAWGRKWSLELTRIAEALFAEYNPIWNYDRYEEWKDTEGKTGTSETGASHNEKTLTNANNNAETSSTSSHVENASSTAEGSHEENSSGLTNASHNENTSTNTEGSYIENANASKTSNTLSESEDSRISQTSSTDSKTANTDNESSHRLTNTPNYKEEKVTENVTNGETEHKVSADNESDYQPASKDITNIGKNKVTDTATGTKDDIAELNKAEGSTIENGQATSEETGRNNSVVSGSGTENTSNDVSGRNNENTSGEVAGSEEKSERNEASGTTNETTSSEASGRNLQNVTSKGGNSSESATAGGSNTKTTDSQSTNNDHIGHLWGNVGVTTSASMVTEVVEQRLKYNLYNTAARLFANELLIGIY